MQGLPASGVPGPAGQSISAVELVAFPSVPSGAPEASQSLWGSWDSELSVQIDPGFFSAYVSRLGWDSRAVPVGWGPTRVQDDWLLPLGPSLKSRAHRRIGGTCRAPLASSRAGSRGPDSCLLCCKCARTGAQEAPFGLGRTLVEFDFSRLAGGKLTSPGTARDYLQGGPPTKHNSPI